MMENVVHIKNAVLAALAALGTFVANALGGWDAALQVLIGLMAADYVTGLIVAVVLAALGYIAASTLTEPERRIGKMLVSALPNGQKTADTIDAANAQLTSIAMLTKQVRDPAVKAEANDFIAATKD